jgi:hypothetical protein
MVPALGVCCNEYGSVYLAGAPVPALTCPVCASILRGHGWHRRFIDGVLTALRRVRCFLCDRTHVVLPADLCAYRDAKLPDVEAAVDAQSCGPTVAAATAGQQAAVGTSAVRRVRRWLRAFDGRFDQRLFALLPPVEGTWLERVRRVVGSWAGALVRLRSWLWEKHRVLFLGPTGLRRNGLVRDGSRRASTDLGILTWPPDSS